MQSPHLTYAQIKHRCTERSFTRGLEYFHDGAIGNPVIHGYTLSATCRGTYPKPYKVSVELIPTGIAAASCSCPYGGEGDCKHIVALLLTYIHAPEVLCSVDTLLATLAKKPKEQLLHIIMEMLKRRPALARIVQGWTDIPDTSPQTDPIPLVTAYREQLNTIFGDSFLEQHQLQQVLAQLEELLMHAESLAQVGETEFALALLHALIHQSIVRYPDTLQRNELPRFVKKCTKQFTRVVLNTQEPMSVGFKNTGATPETLSEHCRLLLSLSFEAAPVFTPILTHHLEQLCAMQNPSDLHTTIEQRLDESPERQAHVQLLLALYFRDERTEDYLQLALREKEGYRLIHALFTQQRDDAAWKAVEEFPLSVAEYASLLQGPIVKRIPDFTERLLTLLGQHYPDTAILLYQSLIEQTALFRKREAYEKVSAYLIELRALYQHLGQEEQWRVYFADLREQHTRKRLLLQIIDAGLSTP